LIKDKLLELSETIYSSVERSISEKLVDNLSVLNVDDSTLATAFFALADLANESKRKNIADNFGIDIIKRIELLQRLGKVTIPKGEKSLLPLRKQFFELTDDLNIIIIKLFERLTAIQHAVESNLPNLINLAEECLYLYSPIAHRLGIRSVYNVMEDLAFKVLYPDDFKKLNSAIEKRRTLLEKKLKDMSRNLQTLLKENGITAQVHYRVKRLYSIFRKIQVQNSTIDKIFDLMAIRVITQSPENCYIALGVVHRNWIPIENRFRDWVTFPKPNGYRSIQTTVLTNNGDKFEIQIRTEEMHREAEHGSAAHWAYKEKIKSGDYWISRLKEFLENDEYFADPLALQDLLKSEMKRDFIHVLTPNGQIKTLPAGSSVIDFAFSIHTEVGFKSTGARINGKFAKLKTILNTGDVVEIATSKNATPSLDWLNYVKTSRAKTKIALWIKKNKTEQIVEEGRRQWAKYKKKNAKKLDQYDDELSFKQNLIKVGYKSADDFYSAIGMKSLKTSPTLLRKLYPKAFKRPERPVGFIKMSGGKGSIPSIIVEGMKDIETKIAGCCNPLKGEKIIAFVTQNSEIKIHSVDCRIIMSGNIDKTRLKTAEWISTDSLHLVKLMLIANDYESMFKAVIEKSSESKILISSMERKPAGKDYQGMQIEVEVKDVFHLQEFVSRLKSSANIRMIERI
jgi:GTP pyrophosphokinase